MSGFEKLVNKKIQKTTKFMGEDVTIFKLSIKQAQEIQAAAKRSGLDGTNAEENENTEDAFAVLRLVINLGAEGASELSNEDFESFPMEEVTSLSNAIMEFSGLSAGAAVEGN